MVDIQSGTQRASPAPRPGTTQIRAGIILIPAGFLGGLLIAVVLSAARGDSIAVWPVYLGTFLILTAFILNAIGTAAVIDGVRRRLRGTWLGALAIGGTFVAPAWGIFCYLFFAGPIFDDLFRTPWNLEGWQLRQYRNATEAAEIIAFVPLLVVPVLFIAGLVAGVVWLWRRVA